MTDAGAEMQRLDWLRLARTPGIGPVTFFNLIARFKTAGAALEALPDLARKAGRARPMRPPSVANAEQEIEALYRLGGRFIASFETDYPSLLRAIDPPPPILSCLGDITLANRPTVAIVGSRSASAAGRKIAREMSAELGKAGYVVVSGLARGIDGEAHAASLDTGTIAVLAGGVDHIYPPQHDRLYAAIAEHGLILSERPVGAGATAKDFPRRNRIVTGCALGVVVVEAAERSGTLISARTAAEQNREVMAVPGSPLDPKSSGANRLIRDGAILVRSADDVLESLSLLSRPSLFEPSSVPLTPPQQEDVGEDEITRVRESLSHTPLPIDEIARATGLNAGRCAAILTELELAGDAETLPGGLAVRAVAAD